MNDSRQRDHFQRARSPFPFPLDRRERVGLLEFGSIKAQVRHFIEAPPRREEEKKKLGKKSGQDLTGGTRAAIRLGRQAGRK